MSWIAAVLLGVLELEAGAVVLGAEVDDAGKESAPAASSPEEHPARDPPINDSTKSDITGMDRPGTTPILFKSTQRKGDFIELELLEERNASLGRGVSEEAAMKPGQRPLSIEAADRPEKPQVVGDPERSM